MNPYDEWYSRKRRPGNWIGGIALYGDRRMILNWGFDEWWLQGTYPDIVVVDGKIRCWP